MWKAQVLVPIALFLVLAAVVAPEPRARGARAPAVSHATSLGPEGASRPASTPGRIWQLVGTIDRVNRAERRLVIGTGAAAAQTVVAVPEHTRIRHRGHPSGLDDLAPGRSIRVVYEQVAEGNTAHSIDVLSGQAQ